MSNIKSDSLEEFCLVSEYVTSGVEEMNYLGAVKVADSKFWRRILLDTYMRDADILTMISYSVATMIVSEESEVEAMAKKLKGANYYDTICTFTIIKKDFMHVQELENENWAFKQPSKKSSRKAKDFGLMPVVDTIANGDALKYVDVEQLEYGIAFTKMAMLADQSWT